MSRHEGVSCDSCLKGNFSGKRYKCLICYDYDLCAACYDAGATSSRHSAEHPMQCILSRADFDLFYGGESVTSDQHQSYTCPHCGRMGFTDVLLLEHISTEHADVAAEVVCPVCAAYPGGEPNHVVDDLTAHLMLEHRNANNDLYNDGQLSGMRAVRRMPHHGRTVSNPRARRAANLQYQTSPGSTLMVLSPGDRDREAMDPIAELLSQLSSVRSRSAAAQSISSQLQQLEMQLHTTRYGSSRLPATDRLAAALPVDLVAAPRATSATTITFPPAGEQTIASATGSSTTGSSNKTAKDRSAFLLARLEDVSKEESELQSEESERANKSLFVQELLLAVLATDEVSCGGDSGEVTEQPTTGETQQRGDEQVPKLVTTGVVEPTAAAAAAVPVMQQASVESRQHTVHDSNPTSTQLDRNSTVGPRSGRGVAVMMASSIPPADSSRISVSNTSAAATSQRNLTKRKTAAVASTAARPSKDSTNTSGNTGKRH